jgi:ATP-dependent exoDNAse (exonuclease V) alpha subunit
MLQTFENISKFQDRQKRIAYTAITRAKTTLSVYHSEDMPGYIESAFASIQMKKKVEIRDAFGN